MWCSIICETFLVNCPTVQYPLHSHDDWLKSMQHGCCELHKMTCALDGSSVACNSTLALLLEKHEVIHENITCSVVKRIPRHIYDALYYWFSSSVSAAEALLAIWAPGLLVVSECSPYRQTADGYIRRHCARSFSTALRLSPFNEASRGALEGKRRNMFLSPFIKKHSWEKTVDFIHFSTIHWTKLTCKWQSSLQRWEFFFSASSS